MAVVSGFSTVFTKVRKAYGSKSDWPIPRLGQGAFRIGLEAVYKVFQTHSSIKKDH